MDHTDGAAELQQGIDPLLNERLNPQSAMPAGWVALPVESLRKQGASLAAIGLAAGMILRKQGPSTEEKLRRLYGLEKFLANKLFRELVLAGFLEIREDIYHVNAGGQS